MDLAVRASLVNANDGEAAGPPSSSPSQLFTETGKKKKKMDNDNEMSSDNLTDAVAHLQDILQSREKDLKKREADFSRRVQLFEKENPSMGSDTDVIQLNVGGTTNIAVLRRTLTQFEGSMLATKFYGRWDDSLEKDRDGNFFVDEDPEIFLRLINFLRLRSKRPHLFQVRQPKPEYDFCCMLDYYNLMPGLYPQKWIGKSDDLSIEEESYGTVVLSTKNFQRTTVLHDFGEFSSASVSEFTVEFEKGTTGVLGWLDCNRATAIGWLGPDHKIDKDSRLLLLNKSVPNSCFLSIADRKIFGPDGVLEENMNMWIDHLDTATKITCRHDGNGEYSIEVVGISPPGGVAAMLQTRRDIGEGYSTVYAPVFPMISFSGKVVVSGLKYAVDKL
ncbi:hypothetical protein ACHAWF_005703 [Thalassiosira exigua]